MILIEEKNSVKTSGETSLFFHIDYNENIINIIKKCDSFYYHKKDLLWEIPLNNLNYLIDNLSKYDNIKLNLKNKKEKIYIKYPLLKYKTKPYLYQEEGIQFGLNHDKWLLLDEMGLGKALSLDSKLFTPDGVTYIKDIKLNDTIIGKDGLPTKIIGVYDHNNIDMYKITFSDNNEIKCCKDHLWKITTNLGDEKVVPTSWFLQKDQFGRQRTFKTRSNNYRYLIPLCDPIRFRSRPLFLHPYVMGCLLGDGSFRNAITLSNIDKDLLIRFNELLPPNLTIDLTISSPEHTIYMINKKKENPIKKYLKKVGLYNKYSYEKFIPEDYLFNSVENRLELLRGLLDTDAYVSKDNLIQFTTTSPYLRDQVTFLVESLGGIVNLTSKIGKYNNITCRRYYCLTIRYKDPQSLVFLPRKKVLLKSRKYKPQRAIKSIEYIGKQDARCITVDNKDKLYLTDHCIVTHNTLQTIYLAEELKKRDKIKHCLIICGVNSLKTNWKKEIETHSSLSCKILGEKINKRGKLVIGSIKDRIDDLKNGIKEFFIITNIETLRNKDIIKWLNKLDIGYMILDEAHCCNSPTSIQATNLLKLKKIKYKTACSGTLLLNSPLDLYVPLKWLEIEKSNYSTFKSNYAIFGGPFKKNIIGYKNIDYLKYILKNYSLRRKKEEVLDLPEKNIIKEYLDMTDSESKFYEDIVNGIVDSIDKVKLDTTSILSNITRLRQATSCPQVLTSQKINCIKLNRAYELIKELIAQNHKVVVFSTFKDSIYELAKLLQDYNPLIGTGDIKDNQFANNIDLFQTDSNYKIFMGTWKKCGTGITLTAASYMIFIDTPWTSAAFDQACDRIYRIGAKNNVIIYVLITKNTVDEKVNSIVTDKKALFEYTIDNKIDDNTINILKEYILELKNFKKN